MSDPSSFSAVDEQAAEGHAAAEGVEPVDGGDVGSERTVREMLLSTGRGRSLDEVESPWDPDRGGMTRIMRAIQKATDVDGLPAIADLGIGLGEWWVNLDLDDGESNSDGDSGEPGEPGGPTP
ncbi:hypothetical protein LPA44_04150 [Halobacterium sp. KA-4]|uniref:hypothetical protein n=1 Tax=Halobacterium sp. KA-4 TaxID=2896367 RepID=UPI001E2F6B49|nr:hypothetical protein [Halobacterium sp. KA-4]MCD2199091.1 hypothetical protein [Halobacterium sp. KA-4]